jgi:hypothetical protein
MARIGNRLVNACPQFSDRPDPQFEVRSDKTDASAMHKGEALN